MEDPKVDTWRSNGVEHSVETFRNGMTEERWCKLHDDTVAAMKAVFPETDTAEV